MSCWRWWRRARSMWRARRATSGSLYGTSGVYRGKYVRALTGNEELNVEDIKRDVLSMLLDAIADFGPERFF